MSRHLRLQIGAAVLTLVWIGCGPYCLIAVDDVDPASPSVTDSWSGLTGQQFLMGQYRSILGERSDGTLWRYKGFDVEAGIPLIRPSLTPAGIGLDLYGRYREFGTSDELRILFGPETNLESELISIKDGVRSGALAATVYFAPTQLPNVRPYVQVGAEHFVDNSRITATIPLDSIEFVPHEVGTHLLLVPGVEVQASEWVALRAFTDVVGVHNTIGRTVTGEVILRPFSSLMVRGALSVPYDGRTLGGSVGAGISF